MLYRVAVSALLFAALPSAGAQGSACQVEAAATTGAAWSHWGNDTRNTRYAAGSPGTLTAADVPRLTVKWAYSLGAAIVNARSQPSVAAGRVFIGSEAGQVVSLSAATGCTLWSHKVEAPVRSGVVVQLDAAGVPERAFVGDLGGFVYGLNARTGERLWKVRADKHFAAIITGTPQVHRGVLYVPVSSYESALPIQPGYPCCTFRGSVVAMNATDGSILWKAWTIADSAIATGKSPSGALTKGPSGAAVWSTPTIDDTKDVLYFGTGQNYSDPPTSGSDAIVAVDRSTGRILWARQFAANDAYNVSCDLPGRPNCPASNGPDADFGQPPILVHLPDGRRALLAGQKSGQVHAIDPDREGAVLWTTRIGPGGRLGGAHWGSASDGRVMYVANGGQLLVPIPDTTRKEGVRLEPDPEAGGGLFAIDVATGRALWNTPPTSCAERRPCSPAQSAPVTAIDGAVFSGALDGVLRAWNSNGKQVWSLDTFRDYSAVNGVPARGGALDVSGPVVAGQMLFVTSGYALYGGRGGNVLLALTVDR